MSPGESPTCSPSSGAPLFEQKGPVIFMLFLLLVSGITASVVGYRVKSADIARKSELLKTYESLGGTFEKAHALGTSVASDTMSPELRNFVLAYEVNSRARAYGLYRVLETTPGSVMEKTIESLFSIGATESARSTEDAWRAFHEPVSLTGSTPNINPKAARFARQYDRYLARDTEVKLFSYLRDHRAE